MQDAAEPRREGRCSPSEPWEQLPEIDGPPLLRRSGWALDDLFELPSGSACTLAEVDSTGTLWTAEWKCSGERGFYPASTVKWITGALVIERLAQYGLELDTVLDVAGEEPRSFRELLLAMLASSDNHAFNLLHEAVGTQETNAWLRECGCTHALVRRHFTRPHYTGSRHCRVWGGGEVVADWPSRPEVELPLNDDRRPPPLGNRQQNWMTTDDLVRIASAALMGRMRHQPGFDLFIAGLAWTNSCHVRTGLGRLTAGRPDRPTFAVWNKPGSWPPDGANAEVAYIYDAKRDRHLFFAVYVQGTEVEAAKAIASAAEAAVDALLNGRLVLVPPLTRPNGALKDFGCTPRGITS